VFSSAREDNIEKIFSALRVMMSSRVDHTLATVVRAPLRALNARSMLDRSARSTCDLPF